MNTMNPCEKSVCREIVTKERLYERLNNAIKECEMTIMREETKLETLRHTKRNLDEYFEDLPFVTPTSAWIPVSERLPKSDERIGDVAKYYLVQNEYGDMMVARYTHGKYWDGDYWEQMYQFKPVKDEIVAWMELPRLYEPQESEE